jgi:hypothetical protein
MKKIKKTKKLIGTRGNRKLRRNPRTKKDPITKQKGQTLMEKLGEIPKPKEGSPAAQPQKPPPISSRDAAEAKSYLSTELGTLLLQTLEPISRRDLHPNNLNISYDAVLKAIDIHIVFVDTNTPLWGNLQRVMWRNRMTWRFDGTGPQLMLIVRWFLPYEFKGFPFDQGKKKVGVDPGKEMKPDNQGSNEPPLEPPKLEVVPPPVPNLDEPPTEPPPPESLSHLEKNLEGPVKRMVEEALEETAKEMANE